ncbi:MAG: AarF/UbiB family protein [Bacteriovoracia bacterium]
MSSLYSDPAERDILRTLEAQKNRVIPEAESPALYKTIQTVFKDLSEAKARLTSDQVLSIEKVFILDSDDINAFVYSPSVPGDTVHRNYVFVTRRMIHEMAGGDPSDLNAVAAQLMVKRNAGILAHEVAHPMNNLANALSHSQAKEIRADLEALQILDEAGYPADSLHDALETIYAADERMTKAGIGNLGGAFSSTHPEAKVRLSVQRMAMTQNRFQTGRFSSAMPRPVPPALTSELRTSAAIIARRNAEAKAALEKARAAPATLLDAFSEMERILRESDQDHRIKYNRLLLQIDEMLIAKGQGLSPAEQEKFQAFTRWISQDEVNFQKIFTDPKEIQAALGRPSPSHFQLVENIPAMQTPSYFTYVREKIIADIPKSKQDSVAKPLLARLTKVVPDRAIWTEFRQDLGEAILRDMRAVPNISIFYARLLADLTPEHRLKVAQIFYTDVLPKLSMLERVRFLTNLSGDFYDPTFFRKPTAPTAKTRDEIAKTHRLLAQNPKSTREIAQHIWDNRGAHAAAEVTSTFKATRIDWDLVFQTLGINPQTGRRELNQAVKAYTQTDAYTELLVWYRDEIQANAEAYARGLAPRWADRDLAPHLSGDFNPRIKADPSLHTLATRYMAGNYTLSVEGLFRQTYGERLTEAIRALPPGSFDLPTLTRIHSGIIENLIGKLPETDAEPLCDIQAKAIRSTPLPADAKQKLLRQIFIDSPPVGTTVPGLFSRTGDQAGWLRNGVSDEPARQTIRLLVDSGIGKSTIDILNQARFGPARAAGKNEWSHTDLLERFHKDIIADIRKASTPAELQNAADALFKTAADDRKPHLNTRLIRQIKAAFGESALSLRLDPDEALRLFERLTESGASAETDAFFEKLVARSFAGPLDATRARRLDQVLATARLRDQGTQIQLTRRLIDAQLGEQALEAMTTERAVNLLALVDRYVPKASGARDTYLEELAWKISIRDPRLLRHIESLKSTNWTKINPLLVNFASSVSEGMHDLPPATIDDLIDYFIDPHGQPLPDSVLTWLRAQATDAFRRNFPNPNRATLATRDKFLADQLDNLKLKLETFALDAQPEERIPILESLLNAGKQPYAKAPGFPENVITKLLKLSPDSSEAKTLRAYLRSAPPHEHSTTLSYLLSMRGQDKSTVRSIFEAFGPPGKKGAQFASVWELLDARYRKELEAVKDRAKALTKSEVEEILAKTLTQEELTKIRKVERVVGSASIKTAVLVELHDGRKAVAFLQSPHAELQIKTNLEFAQKFLQELQKEGLQSESTLVSQFIDEIRAVMLEELDMTKEAARIREAQAFYHGLNSDPKIKKTLGEWRFEVPGVVSDFKERQNLIFVDYVDGVGFDALPEGVAKAQAGESVVHSTLRGIFGRGWFDRDRHKGNNRFNYGRRVIHPIDFGQAATLDNLRSPFSADDRYLFAQFSRAVDEKNATAVVDFGLRIGTKSNAPSADRTALETALRQVLGQETNMKRTYVQILETFSKHGHPIDSKFSFGVMKALMILYGENYATPEGFRTLMSGEIRSTLVGKLPQLIKDEGVGACIRRILGR